MKEKAIKIGILIVLVASLFTLVLCFCKGPKGENGSDGNSYSCTGLGTSTDTDIVIASEYEGKPVTNISNDAFKGNSNITNVLIPTSVKTIGTHAFSYCTGLNDITIPDSVTSIGENAFYGCNSVITARIGGSISVISKDSFGWCSSLTTVTISNSVTTIGDMAFNGCAKLNTIKFLGTKAEWNSINKGVNWKLNTPAIIVLCSDGNIEL